MPAPLTLVPSLDLTNPYQFKFDPDEVLLLINPGLFRCCQALNIRLAHQLYDRLHKFRCNDAMTTFFKSFDGQLGMLDAAITMEDHLTQHQARHFIKDSF